MLSDITSTQEIFCHIIRNFVEAESKGVEAHFREVQKSKFL
jgi:hypothetical protein